MPLSGANQMKIVKICTDVNFFLLFAGFVIAFLLLYKKELYKIIQFRHKS